MKQAPLEQFYKGANLCVSYRTTQQDKLEFTGRRKYPTTKHNLQLFGMLPE